MPPTTSHPQKWSGWGESNTLTHGPRPCDFPLAYTPKMAHPPGVEPSIAGLTGQFSTVESDEKNRSYIVLPTPNVRNITRTVSSFDRR